MGSPKVSYLGAWFAEERRLPGDERDTLEPGAPDEPKA
jgi:hypothetical protein